MRCTHQGVHAAHVYSRNKCGSDAIRDDLRAVVHLCYGCHTTLGNENLEKDDVRIPAKYARLAWDFIMEKSKDEPSSRALLGPRP
jgi:hypothetical protein